MPNYRVNCKRAVARRAERSPGVSCSEMSSSHQACDAAAAHRVSRRARGATSKSSWTSYRRRRDARLARKVPKRGT